MGREMDIVNMSVSLGSLDTIVQRMQTQVQDESRNAMQKGMERVAEMTQKLWATMSGTDHDKAVDSWLSPGVYKKGRFQWEATGLSARSIQGYAVGKGAPHDLPSVIDSLGRVHDTDAKRVAPIPMDMASDELIVGVLTMTTTYAPEDSQSSATDTFQGVKVGLQEHERLGSFDGHIRPHTPMTILGLADIAAKLELMDTIEDNLRRALRS